MTKRNPNKRSSEQTVRDIRRATRRQYSDEEKIRIALDRLRGEDSVAELCRREGINTNVYYRWSKEFLEAGKKRLDDALDFTGLVQVWVKHKPRLLSDNGPSYIASDLADYLDDKGMDHTRGRPYHPQTQGKIERWHWSLKNQIQAGELLPH